MCHTLDHNDCQVKDKETLLKKFFNERKQDVQKLYTICKNMKVECENNEKECTKIFEMILKSSDLLFERIKENNSLLTKLSNPKSSELVHKITDLRKEAILGAKPKDWIGIKSKMDDVKDEIFSWEVNFTEPKMDIEFLIKSVSFLCGIFFYWVKYIRI